MRPNKRVACAEFPCADVNHAAYVVPAVELRPERVKIVLISEAAPAELSDYYYAGAQALFAQTTVQAFNDAGAQVRNVKDILDLGV